MAKKKKKQSKKEIKMDFISMKSLTGKTTDEKIEQILDTVKNGHLVVLNEALDADEEAKLVTATMEDITGEFTGIEFCTMPTGSSVFQTILFDFLEKVLRRDIVRPGLTLVGPSKIISEIKRDPDAFYVSAKL